MNWLSYYVLRASGFPADTAKALVEGKVPVGLARKVGHGRLSDLEAIALLNEAINEKAAEGKKDNADLVTPMLATIGQIARHRSDFSVKELLMLFHAREGCHRIGLEDVVGYEAAGLRTAADMFKAFEGGLVNGSDVPRYQALGITGLKDITALSSAGVSHYGVDGYQENGVSDVDRMLSLHRDGIDGKNFGGYQEVGITEQKVMKALHLGNVGPKDVLGYRDAGFVGKLSDMIALRAHDIGPILAERFAAIGFKGNLTAVVQLKDAGLTYGSFEKQVVSEYARAGFAGDAEAMIRLHRAGVPGAFAMAYHALLNGNGKLAGMQRREVWEKELVSAYQATGASLPASGA